MAACVMSQAGKCHVMFYVGGKLKFVSIQEVELSFGNNLGIKGKNTTVKLSF